MKAYTDIEQSKRLAEILPLESADMFWLMVGNTSRAHVLTEPLSNYSKWESYPCWSLSALLSVLPNKIVSHETAFEEEDAEAISDTYYKHLELIEDSRYMCCYVGNGYEYKCVADIPIDACYEMVLKLHELNLL